MLFGGIDVGKEKHRICIKTSEDKNMDSFWFQNDYKGFDKLIQRIPAETMIGLEATNEYHKPLVNFLKTKRFEVFVFNPRKTKHFAMINHISVKTDKVDAGILADFMTMGFHKTQEQTVNKYPVLRQLTRTRMNLVQDQTRYKSRILNRLAVVFPEYEKLFSGSFGKTFNKLLEKYTIPEMIANIELEDLTNELIKTSMGFFRENKAKEIIETARNTIGVKENIEGYIEEIRMNLKYVQELEKDINKLDRKIQEQLMPIEQKLSTIQGINSVLSAAMIAEIGDIGNFKSRRALYNFSGANSKTKQSGKFTGKAKMSKHGNKYFRMALWLGAISCINHNKIYRKYYFKKVYIDKKDKMKAVNAVARKLCYQVFRILKYNENFELEKAL